MSSSFANVSLYIPYVFANISKKTISETFESLRIGAVKRVDFVNKRNAGGDFNAVYIHFNYWYDNIAARNFQERVLDTTREARIVYDEPWYWIVLENKGAKAELTKRKPCLDIEALCNAENDVTPVEMMMTNEDFANLFNSSSNEEMEHSSPNEEIDQSPSIQEWYQSSSSEEMDYSCLLEDFNSEICFAQEDAAFITMDDLVNENRRLKQELYEYMEKAGRLEHEYNMLMDEKISLNNELVWLKEMNNEETTSQWHSRQMSVDCDVEDN